MFPEEMPWLKEYKIFGIPPTLKPYPDRPVYHILEQAAKKFKKNGVIQFNHKTTYPEVKDRVYRLAAALHGMGLRKGDRVATLLPTSLQFVIADYAIGRAGLVHIPGSFLEPPEVLVHKFRQGGPKALVLLDEYQAKAGEVLGKTDIKLVILASLHDFSPDAPGEKRETLLKGAVWMTDLIARSGADLPDMPIDVEKDLETLLFTGGTTGLPKGCMLTHRNIYANSIQNFYAFGRAGHLLKGSMSVLLALPFFHSFGHIIMHTMTYYGFNQILVPDSRDTKSMVEMIKRYYPVMQIGVPTQFVSLAENELKGFGMLGLSGSAPLPAGVQEKFEKQTGGGIMEGYGLSEMSPVTHLNTSFLLRVMRGRLHVAMVNRFLRVPGVTPSLNFLMRLAGSEMNGRIFGKVMSRMVASSAGKKKKAGKEKRGTVGFPFPDTEIKLVDVETGMVLTAEEIRAGKTGEMYVKGPQRMLGYWPDPGTGLDPEGYVNTSDVVCVDEHGYFYIVDRTKDMINVSGFKVYSREVDDYLYAMPGVAFAAAVGVPDPLREGSERVVVCVQLREEAGKKTGEKDIIEYLKQKVAKYAVPHRVFILDELPMTPVHKVDKKALRRLVTEQLAAEKGSPQGMEGRDPIRRNN